MLKSNYYISRQHNLLDEPVARFIVLGLLLLLLIIIFHRSINQTPKSLSQSKLTTVTQSVSVASDLSREQAIKTIISDGRNIASPAYGQNNQISSVAQLIHAANRPYFFITQE